MIPRVEVERRVERIRTELGADALPADGSPAAHDLRRWVLQSLVSEAIVRREAVGRGIIHGSDAPASDGLAPGVAAAVFDAVTADVVVDEQDIARYYAANEDRYHQPEARRVRQVVVEGPEQAVALAAGDICSEKGPSSSEMVMHPGRLTGPLEEAVFAARPGEVIGPVQTELGWDVAVVEEALAATVPLAESTVAPGYEHPARPDPPAADTPAEQARSLPTRTRRGSPLP